MRYITQSEVGAEAPPYVEGVDYVFSLTWITLDNYMELFGAIWSFSFFRKYCKMLLFCCEAPEVFCGPHLSLSFHQHEGEQMMTEL